MKYHPDEIRIQERAGVREIAERKKDIYTQIPEVAKKFLEQQPLLFTGVIQGDNCVWASFLQGPPGFIEVLDSETIRVNALPYVQDPSEDTLGAGAPLALIAVDFETRRRMRLNGRIQRRDEGGFLFHIDQVYSNCPKYIQARAWTGTSNRNDKHDYVTGTNLSEPMMQIVTQADTLFIASHHAEYGMDVSHRGGMPGFVQVKDTRTLWIPDYKGNSMFNTLGNLLGHPQAGLLFLNFETGDILQMSGVTEVHWDAKIVDSFPSAERVIEFHIEAVRFISHAVPMKWSFLNYSPVNPKKTV
ncbi:pyridoxamine 5'-phosphate oxidase family protein [Paenibacillus zeisoli]|uniref:Pyridoxamine 5'-phosphate oxidase family protein n=1 Tax=Paenibacillus zeisoli TaxID=2496267 RepID=A0A433XI30_9BACL|nr:pyridoxamine 5'-phosphate oxidase family protein [Paenibacillus zeisoli]RUT33702.1 pyridoxamine 5'-phosphate oxidase family protein [Paenibacillus zeisoli]